MTQDDHQILGDIMEALLEQSRAIRDVKIQAESLKRMMLEHRPAFVPTFAEKVRQAAATPAMQELDSMIQRLETAIRALRKS
jgi:hypothetical protein